MKALIKQKPEPGIRMADVDVPKIGVNDVLIKIKKTSICGTDLHIYRWDEWSRQTIRTPMIIGHEYVGTITELGEEVIGFSVGDRVTGEGHIACGICRNCRRGKKHVCENTVGVGVHVDGAFAEYLKIPAGNVLKIHDDIEDDLVSIMDPLGNATHTALSFPLIGEDVLVTGSGLIGSMCIAICKFAGARYIVATEINPFRRELAKKMGATKVINPLETSLDEVIKELGMVGFDIGLECSGSPQAFNDMIKHMYNSGKISQLGILPPMTSVEWDKIIFKALTIKGIYGREMFETWYKMEQMLHKGLNIKPIITHRFKVDDYQKGFEIMDQGDCGKVILDWE
jgi:threonine 3-dehydrogenase